MENHFLITNKKTKESWQKNAIYLSIGFRKRAALYGLPRLFEHSDTN